MTLLSLLPSILILMTSFTRIIIVLSLLRQAMGTAQTPPNQVLIGIALFLTLFIMNPILQTIYDDALEPVQNEEISFDEGLDRARVPLQQFMLGQTREKDMALFMEMSDTDPVEDVADLTSNRVGARLYHIGAQDRFHHRLFDLHTVHHHRLGGGQRTHVHGYDDVVAHDDLDAVQAALVRAG
jgi:hypothetical protein